MAQAALDQPRDRTVTRALHKLFWKGMAHHRLSFSTVMLFQLPSFFMINVFVPLQIAYGIQDIIHRDFDRVGHQAVIIVLSALIGAAFFAAGQFIYHINEAAGGTYVQRAVFANFLNKDYEFYSSQYIGSLGSDAVEMRKSFQQYALIALFTLPRMLVIIFLGLAVIYYKSLALGLVTTLCVVVIVTVTAIGNILRLKYRRELSQANSRLSGMMGDPLSHGAAVKSFAQEDYELQRLQRTLNLWKRAQLRIYNSSIPITFVRHILLAVTSGVLLIVSANLYKTGKISVAVVALAQLYAVRIVTTIVDIGDTIKEYEALMSSSYQAMATMMVPNTVQDAPSTKRLPKSRSHQISFESVSYRYPEAAKGRPAVSDLSLTVANGEKVGLIGYSGGGKTTLTKLLLRFMDATEGQIKLDGVDLRQLKQADLRRLVSYVPQEPLLFHRSIKDNIAYAEPTATDKKVLAAARTAYVDEFVRDMPKGYESMVGERGVKLSGGQRQRVAIARALLKDAPILVLDEATSALDSQSEQYIQKALWQLMAGRTTIVIAHRLSTIQHMDRIVVLDAGRISQVGSHEALLKDKAGIYARLWARQSGGYLGDA